MERKYLCKNVYRQYIWINKFKTFNIFFALCMYINIKRAQNHNLNFILNISPLKKKKIASSKWSTDQSNAK